MELQIDVPATILSALLRPRGTKHFRVPKAWLIHFTLRPQDIVTAKRSMVGAVGILAKQTCFLPQSDKIAGNCLA
jgi:hypothetical protein